MKRMKTNKELLKMNTESPEIIDIQSFQPEDQHEEENIEDESKREKSISEEQVSERQEIKHIDEEGNIVKTENEDEHTQQQEDQKDEHKEEVETKEGNKLNPERVDKIEVKSVNDEVKDQLKLKVDGKEYDVPENSSAYSSPFKSHGGQEDLEDEALSPENKEELEKEFKDNDIQMRIRDKDVVFIYEIDDMIKEMTSSDKLKPLDQHPEILDTLNRFSKLFRHYIRYRVVDIGDLVGGLFLDGFWKTLLITMDNILQSIDNRFKNRVIKLQKQYSKIIEQMNKKLEDKDKEMKAMDQTEYIESLKERLDLIKNEKIMYQKLAQDKLDFIEMLTSNEK